MTKTESTKKPQFGNKRSHALNATRKSWKPNLQKVKLAGGEVIKLSARELRTLKKEQSK